MESLVQYINPAHPITLLGVLNEQRLKGQLCDVLLIVGDQKFEAHKSVLAASSEYFQALFTRNDMGTSSTVHLDFCEPDSFENVLNFIYSSSLFVDKGSLAAIQELGYSLGISFLTKIMSAKPQVTYRISRRRISSEGEDSRGQQRSVIVCQSSSGEISCSPSKNLNHGGSVVLKQTPGVGLSTQAVTHPSEYFKPNETPEKVTSSLGGSAKVPESNRNQSNLLQSHGVGKGTSNSRPQLTSSVSLSETQIQHNSIQVRHMSGRDDQHSLKPSLAGKSNQTVDRSGPLIKSLLRRSLSMDSPVPAFSPALDFESDQSREQSVVKLATKTSAGVTLQHKDQISDSGLPLIHRLKQLYRHNEDNVHKSEVHVKTEPSSPLADTSDIIRITVGDNLPVDFRDLKINLDEGPQGYFKYSGKRKAKFDAARNQLKKSKAMCETDLDIDSSRPTILPQSSDLNDNVELGDSMQTRMFKCWNCLKVFRSNAGLYRHVNMYHNPEKPYSCDICHKRFHTNFKVWTHCQTQHGIVQNPAQSSSSYTVLDEKLQRKLIDIVREREIKKALMMKHRRNKQGGLQTQTFTKRGLRARTKTYMCPYCGKLFWFQSQLKQHLKMHSFDRPDAQEGEESQENQDQVFHFKEQKSNEVYPCRLCNEKLTSLSEQGNHERVCRHATVCPYCGLRFSSPLVKKEHETHCEYKKLTCLECMRTFKSSFSIWRHQVEVHNQNIMTAKEHLSFRIQNTARNCPLRPPESLTSGVSKEDPVCSDSSGPQMFDSEESFTPEDLSIPHGELRIKEEPQEEAVDELTGHASAVSGVEEPGVWPCEKCGKLFSSRQQLERHQELLCHIKPFICHICGKAFRTNFRLWSHFQSHMAVPEVSGSREGEQCPSSPSPSPPLTTSASAQPPSQSPSPTTEPVASAHATLEHGGTDTGNKPLAPQESDTLFYHAPTLSALTFKRQYMCKLCHRTFKTAFSLWSHEQSHTNP